MHRVSPQRRSAAESRLVWAALLMLFGAVTLSAQFARAEPYMAVREGYKCSQCHVNKTGGGARTDYANVYLQTRLAAGPGLAAGAPGERTNDAGLGRLGPSVSVGADLRMALEYNNFDHTSATVQFGRQTACETCHSKNLNGVGQPGGGKLAEVFLRFQPVPDAVSIVYSVNASPTTSTRDFYGIVETLPLNGYVKAGTFKLPNGLQNTWDAPFQHAVQGGYLGNVGFETIYATGVEFGMEPGPFSVALSVTNPDNLVNSPTDKRYFLTASAVGRLGMIGVNLAQDPVSTVANNTETRTLWGGFLGFSLGRFTLLGQLDHLDDYANRAVVSQEAGMGELDFLIRRGHNLKYLYEVRDPNLGQTGDIHDRQSFIYEAFLAPYLQLRLGYRLYAGPVSAVNANNGQQTFVEGHFIF